MKRRILFYSFIVIFMLFFMLGLTSMSNNGVIDASAQAETKTYKYYYENLNTSDKEGNTVEYELAKEFYQALESINESGAFITGKVQYALSSILTSADIKSWVRDGNLDIPKAFSAARDSFLMDHPELFYVDMYKLTISAALKNGVYSAFIDSGKEDNVYRDNSFKSEADVNKAIALYNTAIAKMIMEAKSRIVNTEHKEDYALALAVNEIMAKDTFYDYGTYEAGVNNGSASTASMAFTAYGALVYNKAVCAGFSFAYKAILDQLDIPCVVVSGYSIGKDSDGNDTGNNVGHSWNYVYLETAKREVVTDENQPTALANEKNGAWFAFDTTWNSMRSDRNKYSAMGYIDASQQHMPDGIISSSKYSLSYPALSALSYGQAIDPNDINLEISMGGFKFHSEYSYTNSGAYEIFFHVSYNGKNAKELLETENLRIAFRVFYMEKGTQKWSLWQDMANSAPYDGSGILNSSGNTALYINSNVQYAQFVILTDVEPDVDVPIIDWKGIYYSEGLIKDDNILFMSQEFENSTYGTYTPAPYVVTELTHPFLGSDICINDGMSEPGNSNMMADKNAILIKIVYNEPLHLLDENKPITVSYSVTHENAKKYSGFVPFPDGSNIQLVEDENGVKNTLIFKFKPSLMYEHDREGYMFTFGNVGSMKIVDKLVDGQLIRTTSDKTPSYTYFVFSRLYMACPNVFGDGRLWIDCCALPTLVDNSDLSSMDFKDENGNSTFSEAERSQMMLVVDSVAPNTQNQMLDEISNNSDINVNKDEIKASQTYDIKLQICNKYPTIPDGSYVKIALGFPEGYGPDDEGVTFKLFHRKHIKGDEYIIEEVPCVVTKFGIVATVTSFSPYMVAVVPEDKATEKTVYAHINGKGGKLSKEDGQIQTVNQGQSYTYTISPDEGYHIYKVTLNGQNMVDKITADGKLVLSYDDLKRNNELEIQYISTEAATRFEENNIVDPVKVIVSADNSSSDIYSYIEGEVVPSNPLLPEVTSDSNMVLIVSCVAAGVAVMVGLLVIVLVVKRKRRTA